MPIIILNNSRNLLYSLDFAWWFMVHNFEKQNGRAGGEETGTDKIQIIDEILFLRLEALLLYQTIEQDDSGCEDMGQHPLVGGSVPFFEILNEVHRDDNLGERTDEGFVAAVPAGTI